MHLYLCVQASLTLVFYWIYHFNRDSETFWKQLKDSRIPETLKDVGGGDVRLTVKACDDEIAFAHAYIQEISARRNALLPVIQFPSEILGSIFRFLLPALKLQPPDSSHDDTAAQVDAGTRSLIAASHVCQRWRDVALEHSELWTILWIKNTPWMHEMISRSRGMPLTVMQPLGPWPHSDMFMGYTPANMAAPGKSSTYNIDFLIPRLFHTIQPKHLSLYPQYMSALTTTLWSNVLLRPAPVVETLQIVGGLPHSHAGVMPIPAQFLGRCAPALKHLSLVGPFSFEALWPSPILRGLVSLTLVVHHMNGVDSNCRVPLQVVLDALQEMHQLETLSLTFPSLYTRSLPGTPTYFSNYEQEYPSMQLPRLSSLILSGGLTEIAALTPCLIISQRATIRCEVILREDEIPQKVREYASKIIHPTIPFSAMKTSEITFVNSVDCTLHIRYWDHTLPTRASAPENLGDPRVALSFSIPWPPPPAHQQHGMAGLLFHQHPHQGADTIVERQQTQKLVQVLDAVSVFTPFSQVHDLRWGSHPDSQKYGGDLLIINESSYAEILRHVSQTKRLFFTDTHRCSDMITAMTSNSALLPHLTSIHFASTSSREQVLKEQRRVPPPVEDTRVQEALQDLATKLRRLAETRNIQTLEWRGGLIRQKYTPLFEGIAKELVWEL